MTASRLLAVVLVSGALLHAQERKIPQDSELISIPGCAKGRTFIVASTPEHEPVRSEVAPGRRFRLSGPKKLLGEIQAREGRFIEVTGLIRKADLSGPGGISAAGGRVRVGAGRPQEPVHSQSPDLGYSQAVIDVEGWRLLADNCPSR